MRITDITDWDTFWTGVGVSVLVFFVILLLGIIIYAIYQKYKEHKENKKDDERQYLFREMRRIVREEKQGINTDDPFDPYSYRMRMKKE